MTKKKNPEDNTEETKMGRPTDYTLETADKICARLVKGESLNHVSQDIAMPSIVTMYKWMRDHPDFLKKYEYATTNRVDTLADEIVDIADNKDEKANVNRDRLRIDARKWVAERMRPKKYGLSTKLDEELKKVILTDEAKVNKVLKLKGMLSNE